MELSSGIERGSSELDARAFEVSSYRDSLNYNRSDVKRVFKVDKKALEVEALVYL